MHKLFKALRAFSLPGARRALLRYGVAAGVEHRTPLAGMELRTVVDIGANRGQFSLLARALWPQARIIAFEPLPGPAAIYKKIFRADAAASLHEVAIGVEDQERTMHVSARDDSSSLLPIGDEQFRVFPGTQEVNTLPVRVMPLDKALENTGIESPALLKLDVQGFELEALRGCEPMLAHFDHVYCECSFMEMYEGQALADEVIAWLRERGFRLGGVYNMAYDAAGKSVQADFVFSASKAAND